MLNRLAVDCPRGERSHRLGRTRPGRSRPVILKLLDFNDKLLLLKNAYKLKNSDIKLPEDFSLKVRAVRKKLWDASAEHRNIGSVVKMRFDHLFIDNVQHNWDGPSNRLIIARGSDSNARTTNTSSSLPLPSYQTASDLAFLNVNARSITNKFSQFFSLVSSCSPRVICITETWLHDEIHDSEFMPPGYIALRCDRQNGKGGSVALLLRSDFSLLGDFNVTGIHWPSLTYSASSTPVCRDLGTFSLSHSLIQLVHKNTRQNSILDLVFVSNSLAHLGVTYNILEGISDHNAVLVHINCPIPHERLSYTTYNDFTTADDTSITDALADNLHHFVLLSTECHVDVLVDYFESLVKLCIARHVPLKTKKINNKLPWINRDILHLSRLHSCSQ